MTQDGWRIGVVIPACNEEALIGRCLSGVSSAIGHLRATHPRAHVSVWVVLDSCSDRTAEIVAAHPHTQIVTTQAGLVGVARAAGVDAFAAEVGDPHRAWVACTDADSVVPPHWLSAQVDLAESGHALVAGMVTVDLVGADPRLLLKLAPHEAVADGHPHIYGANLGFTLDTYLSLGGFAPVAAHEDVRFVRAARLSGRSVFASGSLSVLTSPRLEARAPEGFGEWLRELAETPRHEVLIID